MKKCGRCKLVRPFSDFQKHKGYPDGHFCWCYPCKRAYDNERNAKRRKVIYENAPTEYKCRTCNEVKPIKNFTKNSSTATGFDVHCKPCEKLSYDAEAKAKYDAEYRAKNKAKLKKDHSEYYLRNRERLLADGRKRYRKNRKRSLATAKAWAKKNPESMKEYSRRYKAKRAGAFVEKIFTRRLLIAHEWTCGLCGLYIHWGDWHLDHIYPISKGGRHSYANCQPAHPSCNISKGAKILEPDIRKWESYLEYLDENDY